MEKIVLGFDGGVNSKADPSVLKPDILTDCVNYENKDAGKITKRVKTAEFNSGLDTIIASTFDEMLYIPEEPFYPNRVLEDMAEDVMYPVFGIVSGNYKLYLFYYDTSNDWIAEEIAITGIDYISASTLRISYDQGIMYIADWCGVNKSHRVYINIDNELIAAINKIPRPLNKLTGEGIDTFNLSLFQDNLETGAYINYCGVYRYWYTLITKDKDESNPSPASEWFDFQFFKKDDDDLDERMVKAVTMSNFEITSNAADMEDQIKWYGIYREELQFVEGIEIRTPKFIKKILSENTTFTDTIAILSGDVVEDINYENDSSPVGKDIFSVGGALVLAGIQKKLEFPFDFDYYREITLTNPNAKSYVNGVFCIKFRDALLPDWDYLINNLDKVRLFDNDLTTPIPTVAIASTGDVDELGDLEFNLTNAKYISSVKINETLTAVAYAGTSNKATIVIISTDTDGTPTVVGTPLEHDGAACTYQSIDLIDSKHLVLAYVTGTQLLVKIFTMNEITYILTEEDDHEIVAADGVYPSIKFVDSGNLLLTYGIAAATAYAYAETLTYDGSYNISDNDQYKFGESLLGYYMSHKLIKIDDYLFVNAYQYMWTKRDYLIVFELDSVNYTITEKSSLDEVGDYPYSESSLAKLDDTHFIKTFNRTVTNLGYAKTYELDKVGWTISVIDSFIFKNDLVGDTSIVVIDANNCVVAYSTGSVVSTEKGEIVALQISDAWVISREDSPRIFDADKCIYVSLIISSVGKHYLSYSGKDDDGFFKTFYYYPNDTLIVRMKIPEMPISGSKKIYQVWCDEGGSEGVNLDSWRDAEYGQFVDATDALDWATQKTFGNVGVNDVDTIICAPCQDSSLSEVINKADMNTNGVLDDAVFHSGINICELPVVSAELPDASKAIFLTNSDSDTGCKFNFDPRFGLPSSGNYIAGYIYIPGTDIAGGENVLIDMEFWDGSTEHFRLWLSPTGEWKTTCHGTDATFSTITDVDTTKDERYFVCLSWGDDENISLFVYNIADDTFEFEENPNGTTSNNARYQNFNMFHFGSSSAGHFSIDNTRYANWIMQKGTYLSAAQVTHQNAVQNLANRMPLTDLGMIGYNWNTDKYNNVIIGDIETLEYKEYPEWAGYSKVNGVSFPDKYIKKCYGEIIRGIPTPSYLKGQTQYKNTVIFFYRNGFSVFPLEGSPDTWRDSAENLIPERKRDGLVCADSLCVTPHGIIWLTETGINLWNASTYRKVTEGRMDIPIKDTYKGIYLPIPEQYALHDNSFTSESASVTFDKTANTITHGGGDWRTDWYKIGVRIFISNAEDTENNKSYLITAVNGTVLTVDNVVDDEVADTVTVKTTKTYIYDVPEDKLTTFTGLDILYATALSGGSTVENLNLFLNSYGELVKYPDYDQDKTSVLAYATKVFQTFYASYQQFNPQFSGSGTVDLKATDSQNGNDQENTDRTIYKMKENFFPIGYFGEKVEIKIKDVDTISNIIIAYAPRNTRR